jgi:hypothetical protein
MPRQFDYGANLHTARPLFNQVYTKEDLKTINKDTDLIAENEINIFTKYITECVLTFAYNGEKTLDFPVLSENHLISHGSNGCLSKTEPGPIPMIYMDRIITKLTKIFPDTDIMVVGNTMNLSWA